MYFMKLKYMSLVEAIFTLIQRGRSIERQEDYLICHWGIKSSPTWCELTEKEETPMVRFESQSRTNAMGPDTSTNPVFN